VVSWANNWFGDAASTKLTPASTFQVSSDLIVTATIDGQVVTFANDWFGESASTTPPPIHFSTESTQVNIAGMYLKSQEQMLSVDNNQK
jgi:hypothetical protein